MKESNPLLKHTVHVVAVACMSVGISSGHAGELDLWLWGQFGTPDSIQLSGAAVSELTGHPNFPDDASISSERGQIPRLASGIQWPDPFDDGTDAAGDNYSFMTEGYLEVPESGEWKFFVRSDDGPLGGHGLFHRDGGG